MFRKKRTYQHPTLGVFTYMHGVWHGYAEAAGQDTFFIQVGGDRDQPNHRHLDAARKLVAAIGDVTRQAMDYLETRPDVREFAEGNGDLVLDGIEVEDAGFDLSLGFTQWPDGYVVVHFAGDKPVDVIMGD